jgi:hypothetical protein
VVARSWLGNRSDQAPWSERLDRTTDTVTAIIRARYGATAATDVDDRSP